MKKEKQQGVLFEKFEDNIKIQKDIRNIKAIIADTLLNSQQYAQLLEETNELKSKLKALRGTILINLAQELDRVDILKIDKMSNDELISDLAINQLMKKEKIDNIEIDGIEYEPRIKVKFIKVK